MRKQRFGTTTGNLFSLYLWGCCLSSDPSPKVINLVCVKIDFSCVSLISAFFDTGKQLSSFRGFLALLAKIWIFCAFSVTFSDRSSFLEKKYEETARDGSSFVLRYAKDNWLKLSGCIFTHFGSALWKQQ